MVLKPVIKAIVSPNIEDLPDYSPEEEDNFGFLLQLLIGLENEQGMESFQIIVCTPKWFAERYAKDSFVLARNHVMVFNYDYNALIDFINLNVRNSRGESWQEIANKLSRFAYWEFENYNP